MGQRQPGSATSACCRLRPIFPETSRARSSNTRERSWSGISRVPASKTSSHRLASIPSARASTSREPWMRYCQPIPYVSSVSREATAMKSWPSPICCRSNEMQSSWRPSSILMWMSATMRQLGASSEAYGFWNAMAFAMPHWSRMNLVTTVAAKFDWRLP